MFTFNEMIVLVWLAPVALNILLPLVVLIFWLVTKPFRALSRKHEVKEEQFRSSGQVLSSPSN